MSTRVTAEETARLRAAIKARDAWWARLVIGPLANRFVGRVARYPWVTPNRLTVSSLVVGLVAAALFTVGRQPALAAGGIVLQLSFLLDCSDGQLSRFRGSSSLFGAILDRVSDRVKVFASVFTLAVGVFRQTDVPTPFVLALVFLFSESMIEHYTHTYRQLSAGAVAPSETEPGFAAVVVAALRFLDLPIVRLGFADRYFLMSVFAVVGAIVPLLWLLAVLGSLQVLLRPVYAVAAFRSRFGYWPWNDERPHRLGQNF
ncbi:MAG: CDP-alcohol phosphatidyltransferase family protein [Candidatus Binatia bacterium]